MLICTLPGRIFRMHNLQVLENHRKVNYDAVSRNSMLPESWMGFASLLYNSIKPENELPTWNLASNLSKIPDDLYHLSLIQSITKSFHHDGPCYLDLVLDCQQCCWHVAEVPTEFASVLLYFFAGKLEVGDGGSNVLLPNCFVGGGVGFDKIPKLRLPKPFYSKPPTSTIHRLD